MLACACGRNVVAFSLFSHSVILSFSHSVIQSCRCQGAAAHTDFVSKARRARSRARDKRAALGNGGRGVRVGWRRWRRGGEEGGGGGERGGE